MDNTRQKIDYIYNQILQGIGISWGQIAYLQTHQDYIKKVYQDEPILWEWSGIDESEWLNRNK